MEFRIADTFTSSLAKLTGEEQKAVKTTAFDLQLNPAHLGMSFHKLDGAKDPNFWSVRVNRDIRLIVHRTDSSLLLCYVDHHDPAYRWAERRKLATHPKTGAAQWVEIRETVQEITVPRYVEAKPAKRLLFAGVAEESLLSYGVPEEWLDEVRQADEDTLLDLADRLPAEAAEALLELATGGRPAYAMALPPGADPFAHPDALRRFRVMNDVEELAQALEFPWEKWAVFLHPEQRRWVTQNFDGPARVAGSAGTGKTIVALHRAVHLTRNNPDARVLLATFSDTLANALHGKLRCLISREPHLAERLEVLSMNAVGERLYRPRFGKPNIPTREQIRERLAAAGGEHKFSPHFLLTEWEEIVDARQLASWEEYRDVKRLGRKTRLSEAQRASLWVVFERLRALLREQGFTTRAEMFAHLTDDLRNRKHPPFDFAVVDEAQDIRIPQLRFLAALAGDRPNGLFFAGDLGQRIFQQPFSWKEMGVDVRGGSRTLHINYRTSHQIRSQADRLLDPEVADVDGNVDERRGTISVFNGPAPNFQTFEELRAESRAVGDWLKNLCHEGIAAHEIGVFVRTEALFEHAAAAVKAANLPFKILDDNVDVTPGYAAICTMHLAKGLEFRAVSVMGCDDETIPLQTRIESVADDADLEEVYNTERHLLYVACTRARDHLLLTCSGTPSEFLDDLRL